MTDTEKKEILSPINQGELYGYTKHFNYVAKLFELQRRPNCLLITGQKGIGKSTFVYHLVNYLLSKNEGNEYSIEKNAINIENKTYQLILNNTHPNFYLISNNMDNNEIKIDQIRSVIKFINKTSFLKKIKIIYIDNAEYLNKNSANSLLKAIEEPPENTFFILSHDSSFNLMDTIKSRSFEYRIFFTIEEKKLILKKLIKQYDINIDIDEVLDFSNVDTPGNLLKYLFIFNEEKFDFSKDYLKNALYFIDKYKVKKDYLSLHFINIFVEKFYNEIYLNSKIHSNDNYFYHLKILKLLQNMQRFKLDINNSLFQVKNILLNAER